MTDTYNYGLAQNIIHLFNAVGLYPKDLIEILLALLSLFFLLAFVMHIVLVRRNPDYEYSRFSTFLWPSHHLFAFFFGLLFIRATLFEPHYISRDTLVPALRTGDHILLGMFQYALRLPMMQAPVFVFAGPQRGDIVYFANPEAPEQMDFFRIIGLPGEHVRYNRRTGEVYINGNVLLQTIANRQGLDTNPGIGVFEEHLGERSIIITKKDKAIDRLGAWLPDDGREVPAGHYFGLYDARYKCCDSREIGVIALKDIKGKAFFIYMNESSGISFNRNGLVQ